MKRVWMLLVIGLGLSLSAQATMYKWVDKNGKVHYGDTIPPEYANQGSAQMNRQGQVIKKTAPALTPEQIRARDEEEARIKAEKEQALEQQRRDKALLATYTNEQEIDLALQRNLDQIDIQIKSNELRIKSVQGRLEGVQKQRESIMKRNKPVPDDLNNEIKATKEELARFQSNIANLEKEKEGIRARFSADKSRFRVLKGMPAQ